MPDIKLHATIQPPKQPDPPADPTPEFEIPDEPDDNYVFHALALAWVLGLATGAWIFCHPVVRE